MRVCLRVCLRVRQSVQLQGSRHWVRPGIPSIQTQIQAKKAWKQLPPGPELQADPQS
ncbi:MAG: hypothetical protein Q6K80_10460 [Thermostichus sp. DG_1_6_bins_120]